MGPILTILASAFALSIVSAIAKSKSNSETLEKEKEVLNSSENKNTIKKAKSNSETLEKKKEVLNSSENKNTIKKAKAKSNSETLEKKKEILNSSENKNIIKKENSKLNVDKKELKSTMVNKVQIRKDKKGDFYYNYIWDYYPKRYTDISKDDDDNRENIYIFKKGKKNDYFLDLFSNVVENNYEEKENLIIMPIPASTKENNEIRFKNILMKISDKTKIENGFDYIKVSFNRETKHLSKQVVSKDINYTINAEKIKGKKIILLDDVITTGKGFITLAKNLKELGASSVEGLFLSKTYNYSNKILEYEQKSNFTSKNIGIEKKPGRCPWCGGSLIKRSGTREFFGCTNYPDCEYEQIIFEGEEDKEIILEPKTKCIGINNEIDKKFMFSKELEQKKVKNELHLDSLSPYELGESNLKEAIPHLKKFLESDSYHEKRLAASATKKLSKLYKSECQQHKDDLVNMVIRNKRQIRQYALDALIYLELDEEDLNKMMKVAKYDETYNKKKFSDIFCKYKIKVE